MSRHVFATALFCILFVPTVSAEPDCDPRFPHCAEPISQKAKRAAPFKRAQATNRISVAGRRPPGCPRDYCGCAMSLKLFGKIIPRLNLAANWIKFFPRERAPRAGLVAARRGHVMLLMEQVGDREWLVFDPNSGGGRTHVHVRNVAGHVFINPKASAMAAMAGP